MSPNVTKEPVTVILTILAVFAAPEWVRNPLREDHPCQSPPVFPTCDCPGRSPLPPVPPNWPADARALRTHGTHARPSAVVAKGTPFSFLARRMRGLSFLSGARYRFSVTPNAAFICSAVPSAIMRRRRRGAPRPAARGLSDTPRPGRLLPSPRHAARRTLPRKDKPVGPAGYPPNTQDRAPPDCPASGGQSPRR